MEDVFQILMFVAFAAIGVLLQMKFDKKESPAASPKEVLEEMFPELNEETEMSMSQPVEVRPISKKKKKKSPKVEIRKPEETGTKPSETPPSPSQAERKIRLSNREEARRAFIYSEIFNRKY